MAALLKGHQSRNSQVYSYYAGNSYLTPLELDVLLLLSIRLVEFNHYIRKLLFIRGVRKLLDLKQILYFTDKIYTESSESHA